MYATGYLAKLVQDQEHFQARFSEHQRDYQRQCPRVWRNLSCAKQRFDSTALPLGRLGDEVCLQLGMLADVAQGVLQLIWFFE